VGLGRLVEPCASDAETEGFTIGPWLEKVLYQGRCDGSWPPLLWQIRAGVFVVVALVIRLRFIVGSTFVSHAVRVLIVLEESTRHVLS
jgi:hypothetical protein